jgi:hypothetical protein
VERRGGRNPYQGAALSPLITHVADETSSVATESLELSDGLVITVQPTSPYGNRTTGTSGPSGQAQANPLLPPVAIATHPPAQVDDG